MHLQLKHHLLVQHWIFLLTQQQFQFDLLSNQPRRQFNISEEKGRLSIHVKIADNLKLC